jgi:hypothetical protein
VIGKDGSRIRFSNIEDLPSDCTRCASEVQTRMFCPEHRQGRPCNWCADRGYRVLNQRWIPCDCTDNREERK